MKFLKDKMNKVLSVVCCCLCICTCLVFGSVANNHSDTSYSLTVGTVLNDYSDARKKEDDSGSYVNFTGGTLSVVRYSIYGSNYTIFPSIHATNYTKGGYGSIQKGHKNRIRQYVYENGKTYAYLVVEDVNGGDPTGTCSGKWSPDSIGSDTYCN